MMKTHISKISLLIASAILLLITCKSPVNKIPDKAPSGAWIEEMTISNLQQGYKEGKYTISDVVKVYLGRINEIDKNGPKLNSVIIAKSNLSEWANFRGMISSSGWSGVGGSSSLAAISGYPAITVPMGFVDELPVGVTFFGTAWSEPILIEIAYSYEQGTKHRKTPGYITTD